MEGYIDDLLRRIADEETDIWHRAYDEAKALNDLLIFPYLQGKLSKAKKVSMKKDIYYLMTKLAINTKEICIADYLIDCLEYEDSPTLLSELLSNIYTLPVVSSTNKIIPYIYHKNDSVRFLHKFVDREEVLKTFDKVYKKRGNLFMSERKWLRDNIAYFQEKDRM
ncbi:TPA: hypothetical protein ACQ75Q_004616 [Bacillus thuringiensis]|uniref:Uncharacterized protein n=1 Tax=Bacillus cereus (strain VD014) TaxID=1053223 RepID=A0A9W5KCE2_BACC8|nr:MULTISPECIES: hypothetical protein [Bacillus cereus group]EJR25804.1 hypothetical protein IIA_00634 [Bacillus cereus VD014]KLA22984.1 hypothetical protein B4080_0727 [Bacillus cereus]MBJ8202438.1 hypothetical protein [Bacillus cereus]MCU4845297.1 hypothetical protein [Bacillus cereus]TBX45435.1 hypothetical protein E0M35_09940 [Bacillus thuringiensis]